MTWLDMNDFDWMVDPLKEMERLRRELGRILGQGSSAEYPLVRISANDEAALVSAEIPGIDPDKLSVAAQGATLTIEGERVAEDGGGARYIRRERGFGRFKRLIRLPFEVDAEKVEAKLSRGVLEIRLPRRESSKPKRIAIKGE